MNKVPHILASGFMLCGILFSTVRGYAQSMVNNKASVYITGSAGLYINGALQNSMGSAISNNGSIILTDSLSSAGNLTGSGRVHFSGTGSKTLNCPVVNNKLYISDNSGPVILGQSTTFTDSLSIGNGTKLALNDNRATINGVLSGTGTISGNALSSVAIGGSGSAGSLRMDQSIPGSTNRISDLTLNRTSGSVTLANTIEVTGTVTLSNGTMSTGGNLVLVSTDVASTARIAKIQASADISGNVTVQRYIPAGSARRWEFWGSPVSAFTFAQLIDDIHVTGSGGATNGFDSTGTNYVSSYHYDETVAGSSNFGWTAPSSINTALVTARGWRSYFRGNRTTQGNALLLANPPVPAAVTLDYTGAINKGAVSAPVTCSNGCGPDDGWNLVANPYPSPIDWNAATGWIKTNLSQAIYVFNPNQNAYAVWDGETGVNGGSRYIPLGQSFFVKATGTPVLSMTEDVKTASLPAVQLFKAGPPVIRIKLQDSLNIDEAAIKFCGTGRHYDFNEDALKLNGTINISSFSSDQYALAIQNRQQVSVSDTIRLAVSMSQLRTYTITFGNLGSIPSALSILLHDSFTGTTTDLRANPVYAFSVTANAASQGNNRFRVILVNGSYLPVTWLTLNATLKQNRDVQLAWRTSAEKQCKSFVVEKSADNDRFETVGEVSATGDLTVNEYGFFDADAFAPGSKNTLYYRLRQLDRDGSYTYSSTLSVTRNEYSLRDIVLYPVPVSDVLHVSAGNPGGLPVSIEVLDVSGHSLRSETTLLPTTLDMKWAAPGIYFIRLGNGGEITYNRFIKL